jgi:hypothetical protein
VPQCPFCHGAKNLSVDPGEEVQIAFNLSKAASKKDVGSPGAPGKRAKKQMENFEDWL